MDFLEIEFGVPNHTWARGTSLETRTSARLDSALCNADWSLRFPNVTTKDLPAVQSDHCPILISPNGFAPIASIKKPFKFQAAWLTHDNFREFIETKWDKSRPLFPLLKKVSDELQDWNRNVFHNIFKKKRNLLARIGGVQKCLASQRSRDLIKLEAKLRKELDEVLE
ncbi:uncharacterized protein LOC110691999 [Chenopodium quinoa]|uniref:uncharacterized protein LOC110691999 n=1 Tax=Chenopodium quinoa TaxID=63459 RepID=UPI000B799054|nr:uncharacterized protein LOC110691999 [Chenopodium quinoa]